MSLTIFKFGGSSVKDATHIDNVRRIISQHADDQLLIVISAVGKTTNALEKVWEKYLVNKEAAKVELEKILEHHVTLAADLGVDQVQLTADLNNLVVTNLDNLPAEANADLYYDQIISLGELFSTTIIAAYLKQKDLSAGWMDVREVLTTDAKYRHAQVDFNTTKSQIESKVNALLPQHDIIITQGFIGKTKEGMTTTLGREGSDYTAAIFAYSLEVEELTIWKDVQGILTADPRRFDNVELLPKISYREAIEMTYYGAKVIHPKTIQPIQNKNIRLQVRSFVDLDKEGTVIADPGPISYPPIVVVQEGITLLRLTSNDFSFISEAHLSIIFQNMDSLGLTLCAMRNSAISFTLCLYAAGQERIEQFVEEIGNQFHVETYTNLQLYTIRHYNQYLIDSLTQGKQVMFTEKNKKTIQMVIKDQPIIKEKV